MTFPLFSRASCSKLHRHAIAVNQAWAGDQGTEFAQSTTTVTLRERCVKNTICDNMCQTPPGASIFWIFVFPISILLLLVIYQALLIIMVYFSNF